MYNMHVNCTVEGICYSRLSSENFSQSTFVAKEYLRLFYQYSQLSQNAQAPGAMHPGISLTSNFDTPYNWKRLLLGHYKPSCSHIPLQIWQSCTRPEVCWLNHTHYDVTWFGNIMATNKVLVQRNQSYKSWSWSYTI